MHEQSSIAHHQHTISKPKLVAWVVDLDQTAILCHTPPKTAQDSSEDSDSLPTIALAGLTIASSLLDHLKPHHFAFIKPATILADTQAKAESALADVVINRAALAKVGIHPQPKSSSDQSPCFVNYRDLVNHSSVHLGQLASHAIQLMLWRDDNRYCPRCQSEVVIHLGEYAACCPSCQHRTYPKVQPCVITAITRPHPEHGTPQILLALHHRHRNGMHGLIAGFMEIGESAEAAVHREVAEEVGIHLHKLTYITSQPWPYPTNLMLGFWGEYASGDIAVQASELVYAKFFDFDALPKIPPHGTIARTLIEHIAHHHGLCVTPAL